MIYCRPLIYLGIMISIMMYFAASAHAMPPMLVDSNDLDWAGNSPGDPLDPGFVGETMSMPLDPELVQKARDAGIIKDSRSPYMSESGLEGGITNLGTPFPGGEYSGVAATSQDSSAGLNTDVTGNWSLDLISLDQVLRHMDLALIQNSDVIMGYGTMADDKESQRVAANGYFSGSRLLLTVMPVENLYLYKLDLSLDIQTKGTYAAYSADGKAWSGDIAGDSPPGILASAS